MRRSEYAPHGRQESFIVPLLHSEIEKSLDLISSRHQLPSASMPKIALDCGCGNQPLRSSVLDHGYVYESMDIAQNYHGNVDYVCPLDCCPDAFAAVITKLYSLVICTEVLEHVSDWRSAFANLAACTADGGFVVLTAPFFYPLHEVPFDFCRPTIYLFEHYATKFGFAVVDARKCGSAIDVVGTALAAARIYVRQPSTLVSRVVNRLILLLQSLVLKLLVRWRDSLVSDNSDVYLSNLVILQKNCA